MASNQCVPPAHTWFHYGEGIYHITLVGFLALCGEEPIRCYLAVSWTVPFIYLFLYLFFAVSPKNSLTLMSIETKAAVSEDLVVCPERTAAAYLSSAKVPIDCSTDCASVSLPVQPTLRPSPPLPPSLNPSTPPYPPLLCPRPHWSAMPRLLPADQSAWCLLCLGEVNKLLGQSNGKRGASRAGGLAPSKARRRDGMGKGGRSGGVREEKRDQTEGLGHVARFSAWLQKTEHTRGEHEGMVEETGREVRFSKFSRLLPRRRGQIIHLQSTHFWQAPQINTRTGIQSVLRLSASQRFFTTVDTGNNCVHEGA